MNIIIFSRDRACQLELLLRSLNIFFPMKECSVSVLYRATDGRFMEGYRRLIMTNPDFKFVKENDFRYDLLQLETDSPFTTFLCDDDIVIRPFLFGVKEFKDFYTNKEVACLSLRLGKNITENLELGRMTQPKFDDFNRWTWRGADKDWGYPASLSGCHIFRTNEIFDEIININFDSPNLLESRLSNSFNGKPLMSCMDESVVFNNPMNMVQRVFNNKHGDVSTVELNESFLDGNKINIGPFLKSHSMVYDICPVELYK